MSGKILIVDDDQAIRETLLSQLARAGYDVIEASSGTMALQLVVEWQPDVVLLDVRMPGMDGIETCRRIRKSHASGVMYIIMLTGEHDAETDSLDGGANDYVQKPYRLATLLAHIRVGLRTVEQDRRLLEQTEAAFEEAIRRLVTAAEFRDPETGAHIQRMAHYSFALAQAIRLPVWECDRILRAAPLHDVGKLGTPDHILLKPGKLTDAEFEIMKMHAVNGFKMLHGSPSPLIQMGAEIALTHHEKWDGTGYPYGLVEKNIPLAGRIVAIADVFDALTSKRPYKDPWTVEQAVDWLHAQTNRHFDPCLVAIFIKQMPTVLEIRMRFGDA